MEFQFATPSEDAVMGITLESQLEEFGINLQTLRLDPATFQDRYLGSATLERYEEEYAGEGDFTIWQGQWSTTFSASFYTGLSRVWQETQNTVDSLRAYNWLDHEVQEDTAEQFWEDGDAHSHHDYRKQELPYIEVPRPGDWDGELVQLHPTWRDGAVHHGPFDAQDPLAEGPGYYDPPNDEPHEENAEYYWQWFAWLLNWYQPVVPVALPMNAHYYNAVNWITAAEMEGEKVESFWEVFGQGGRTNMAQLHGHAHWQADPENPKDDATVVEE